MLRFFLIALATLIICAGVATWAFSDRKVLTGSARQAAAVLETETYFEATGVLLRYDGSGTRTWYLLYADGEESYMRKELRFDHERGCAPQAGDMPCVTRDTGESSGYTPGSYVRIRGYKGGQRILVDSVRAVEVPAAYRPITVEEGATYRGETYTLTIDRVYLSDRCELYLGCFDASIPRVAFSFAGGKGSAEKLLVPGMLIDTVIGKLVLMSANAETKTASFIVLSD